MRLLLRCVSLRVELGAALFLAPRLELVGIDVGMPPLGWQPRRLLESPHIYSLMRQGSSTKNWPCDPELDDECAEAPAILPA